jgi:hypothetical protein
MTDQNQNPNLDSSQQKVGTRQRMSRTKLVIIISMSFGPIFAAYIVFFKFPELAPTSRTNEGTLINPPFQGGTLVSTNEKWTLIIAVETSCDTVCEEVLHLSRQIHIGLGKNTPRVQRVIVTRGSLIEQFLEYLGDKHNNTKIVDIKGSELAEQMQQVIKTSPSQPIIFLMDPNGNVMMYYPPEKVGKPMQKDLKLLLKLSNIG